MNLILRPAHEGDWPLILAWRSSPLVYQGFYRQTEPLTWEEHVAWFRNRPSSWRTFIVLYGETVRPVGTVTIGQLEHWSPEIGYHMGEVSLWGKGIGKEAVQLAMDYVRGYGREYCHTTILDSNKRSIRLIKALGFEYLGVARKGESWWQKKL